MDSLIRVARQMMRDRFVVARVRARGDDPSSYLVQVHGRDYDMLARSNESHSIGDDVLVLIEPSVHVPHIVSGSPWRVNHTVTPSTNNGTAWEAEDFQPSLDAAISAHPDVAANLAAAHDRLHGWTSADDHSDVIGTPGAYQAFGFEAGAWRPRTIQIRLDGGTR